MTDEPIPVDRDDAVDATFAMATAPDMEGRVNAALDYLQRNPPPDPAALAAYQQQAAKRRQQYEALVAEARQRTAALTPDSPEEERQAIAGLVLKAAGLAAEALQVPRTANGPSTADAARSRSTTRGRPPGGQGAPQPGSPGGHQPGSPQKRSGRGR